MTAAFQFTTQATEDLDAIWWFIAEGSQDAAQISNYMIVYRPDTAPLQVIAILHGKRDMKKVLEERSS